ncbi:hypothetical protein [Streptomyces virginiae]|uniref:hypothetical protein n=1 Tax=Streptomyces virginiae TaxID=1961 RepID=UPI0022594F2F|nr:hypothetical protein [Streptomyces virginiae]MCX5174037.1 hypothetical protein [Streptomyces virginiae]
MADNEGGWRPPDSKHPWLPPKSEGEQLPPRNNGSNSGWRPPQNLSAYVAVILFGVWTLGAIQWKNQDCDLIPTSYRLVITHGFPDIFEGCGTQHGANVDND